MLISVLTLCQRRSRLPETKTVNLCPQTLDFDLFVHRLEILTFSVHGIGDGISKSVEWRHWLLCRQSGDLNLCSNRLETLVSVQRLATLISMPTGLRRRSLSRDERRWSLWPWNRDNNLCVHWVSVVQRLKMLISVHRLETFPICLQTLETLISTQRLALISVHRLLTLFSVHRLDTFISVVYRLQYADLCGH